MKNSTLCHIERGDEWLMMHRIKKENDLNKDKWIGLGGKFEDGESPEECVLREVREEAGLELTSYKYRGIVTFVSDIYETEYMHLFTADGFRPVSELADGADVSCGNSEIECGADNRRGNSEIECGADNSQIDFKLPDCDEGELAWIKKDEYYRYQQWEGDKIFLRLIEEGAPFFSLKLKYEGDTLVYAALNGEQITLEC